MTRQVPEGYIGSNLNPWNLITIWNNNADPIFNANQRDSYIVDQLTKVVLEMKEAGIESIRFPIYWSDIQPYANYASIPDTDAKYPFRNKNDYTLQSNNSSLPPYYWKDLNNFASICATANIKLIPTISVAPNWARDNNLYLDINHPVDSNRPSITSEQNFANVSECNTWLTQLQTRSSTPVPASSATFANFIIAMLNQCPQILEVIIWNEVNLQNRTFNLKLKINNQPTNPSILPVKVGGFNWPSHFSSVQNLDNNLNSITVTNTNVNAPSELGWIPSYFDMLAAIKTIIQAAKPSVKIVAGAMSEITDDIFKTGSNIKYNNSLVFDKMALNLYYDPLIYEKKLGGGVILPKTSQLQKTFFQSIKSIVSISNTSITFTTSNKLRDLSGNNLSSGDYLIIGTGDVKATKDTLSNTGEILKIVSINTNINTDTKTIVADRKQFNSTPVNNNIASQLINYKICFYSVGLMQILFKNCNDLNVSVPKVMITEYGYPTSYNKITETKLTVVQNPTNQATNIKNALNIFKNFTTSDGSGYPENKTWKLDKVMWYTWVTPDPPAGNVTSAFIYTENNLISTLGSEFLQDGEWVISNSEGWTHSSPINITNVVKSGEKVYYYTQSNHNFVIGQTVTISGFTPSEYNQSNVEVVDASTTSNWFAVNIKPIIKSVVQNYGSVTSNKWIKNNTNNAETLSYSKTPNADFAYRLYYTITGNTGNVQIEFGGNSFVVYANGNIISNFKDNLKPTNAIPVIKITNLGYKRDPNNNNQFISFYECKTKFTHNFDVNQSIQLSGSDNPIGINAYKIESVNAAKKTFIIYNSFQTQNYSQSILDIFNNKNTKNATVSMNNRPKTLITPSSNFDGSVSLSIRVLLLESIYTTYLEYKTAYAHGLLPGNLVTVRNVKHSDSLFNNIFNGTNMIVNKKIKGKITNKIFTVIYNQSSDVNSVLPNTYNFTTKKSIKSSGVCEKYAPQISDSINISLNNQGLPKKVFSTYRSRPSFIENSASGGDLEIWDYAGIETSNEDRGTVTINKQSSYDAFKNFKNQNYP